MPKEPKSLWLREDPLSRGDKISRPKIAEVAVAIADAEGFDAVSMRRVADALGVGTMSLYHYVKTRGELTALMDDALMGELVLKTSARAKSARGALLAIARATHAMFERHPWAVMAMRGAPPGPNALLHFEQCLEALSSTKLGVKEKLTLLALIDDLVFGAALRATESPVDTRLAKKLLASGGYPLLEQTFAKGALEADPRRLERGLEALLDNFGIA